VTLIGSNCPAYQVAVIKRRCVIQQPPSVSYWRCRTDSHLPCLLLNTCTWRLKTRGRMVEPKWTITVADIV